MLKKQNRNYLTSAFEGTYPAGPLGLYRFLVYAGILIHFAPSLIFLEENYGSRVFRMPEWNTFLFDFLPAIPEEALVALSALTLLACVTGLLGLLPRTSAIVGGLGLYAFASFNSISVQTLALSSVWAILPLFAVSGAGSEGFSVSALWRRYKGRAPRPAPKWVRTVLLAQVLIGFFFAGVEKVMAGWPMSNEMYFVLNYPKDFMMRDWTFALPFLRTREAGLVLSVLTVFVELVVPLLLVWRPTRLVAFLVFEGFFAGVVATLEVPPLFYAIYAPAALLAFTAADWERYGSFFARRKEAGGGHDGSASAAELQV